MDTLCLLESTTGRIYTLGREEIVPRNVTLLAGETLSSLLTAVSTFQELQQKYGITRDVMQEGNCAIL